MAISSATSSATKPVSAGRIVVFGLVATVLAVLLNLAVGLGLRAALGVSDKFLPLTPGAIIFFTLLPSIGGVVLFLIVRRIRVFAIVGFGLAVVSLIAPLGLLGADATQWEGLTTGAALALVPLHLLPALVLVGVLRRG